MSTRSKAAILITSAGVLAAAWQIGTHNGQLVTPEGEESTGGNGTGGRTASPGSTATTTGNASATTTGSSAPTSGGTTTRPATTTAPPAKTGVSGTFTGSTVSTQYGPVTVTITLSNGIITNVSARISPIDSRSQTIQQNAIAILKSEVLAANSANISTVSGATFTSRAYITSLQSAIDTSGR